MTGSSALPRRIDLHRWVVLGVLIGIVAGLGAILFYAAIQLATPFFLGDIVGLQPPLPRGEGLTAATLIAHRWLLPFVTTLGGLISGVIVFTLALESEDHGTDAAVVAYLCARDRQALAVRRHAR